MYEMVCHIYHRGAFSNLMHQWLHSHLFTKWMLSNSNFLPYSQENTNSTVTLADMAVHFKSTEFVYGLVFLVNIWQ